MADSEGVLQLGDCPFSRPQLEDDAQAMRMGKGAEHVGEFFGGEVAMWHDVHMFKYLNT